MKSNKELFRDFIDRNIQLDLSTLPKSVVELIEELERLNKEKDWFFYDIKFDELEIHAKAYVRHNKMSESTYKKILAKYGGLYD